MDIATETTDVATTPLPEWFNEIGRRFRADKSQFLLDFNVRDLVFTPDEPPSPGVKLLRVNDFLLRELSNLNRFDLILTYSSTTGLDVYGRDNDAVKAGSVDQNALELYNAVGEKVAAELMKQLDKPTDKTLPFDRDPVRAFLFLDRLLTRKITTAGATKNAPRQDVRIALIVDYLENLAPATDMRSPQQVLLAETFSRWANSATVRQNGHLVLLLAEDINQVAPTIYAGASGTVNLRLNRPTLAERLAFFRWLSQGGRLRLDEADEAQGLAALTAGFNFAEIDDLVKFAEEHTDGVLAPDLIRQRKRDVIRGESRDLLEFIETDVTFDHVGGLEHVKRALRDVAQWLRSQETARLAPKGIFFVGPPGTGKSLLAQALARESGINMVKLRDVQSMWVGASERNMSRVLDIARAFAPIIIFVDEIDQAYGQRGGGDTTGVSSRLFGKLLEFIGDNANRGKVLWIAASNRPDFVDAALISRFDRVVPFLLPDRAGREQILLRAMPRIVQAEWQDGGDLAEWPDAASRDWEAILDATEEFSGRELELVVRRGVELAEGRGLEPACVLKAVQDFEHSHDRDVYRLQTLLALQVTNFKHYLPDLDSLAPRDLAREIADDDSDNRIDRAKVQKVISDLRRALR